MRGEESRRGLTKKWAEDEVIKFTVSDGRLIMTIKRDQLVECDRCPDYHVELGEGTAETLRNFGDAVSHFARHFEELVH